MALLLFGNCGCGQGQASLGSDLQTVDAFVPFNFGWAQYTDGTWDTVGDMLAYNKLFLPQTIFLRQTIIYTSNLTGQTYTQIRQYTQWGVLAVNSPVAGPPTAPPGEHWVAGPATYDLPYTWAQATAAALGLLNSVGLINPGATYPCSYFEFNYGGLVPGGPSVTVPTHLCYTSELGLYNQSYVGQYPDGTPAYANTATTRITVIPDANGNAILINGNWQNIFEETGYAAAANGAMFQDNGAPGVQFNGLVSSSKCAIRSPVAFNSFETTIIPFGYTQPTELLNGIIGPLQPPLPPGEYTLDPSDVPGFGTYGFSTAQAPSLPPP